MLERAWRKGTLLYCTVDRNVNLCNHYGKQYESYSKKLKIELIYDLAIPLLGIYLGKNTVWKDTCTPMTIASLFTIAKTWMSIDGGMDKENVVHVYKGIVLSHKEWNHTICNYMDGSRDYHTK